MAFSMDRSKKQEEQTMPMIDAKFTVKVDDSKKEEIKSEFGKLIATLHKGETYHPLTDWGWNGKNF